MSTPTSSERFDPRAHVDVLVRAALAAARPNSALVKHWPQEVVTGPCRVLAVGKAAGSMIGAMVDHGLCWRVEGAVVVGPPGVGTTQTGGSGGRPPRLVRDLPIPLEVWEADHPLPTERNIDAARRVAEFVSAGSRGLDDNPLIVLLSGGASAMLTLPTDPLTLEDCRAVTSALLRGGAPIEALNCVRKHLEVLKGGGLARLAAPKPVWTLVLSDVIGDDVPSIGSGPTSGDPTTFSEALDVLDLYGAMEASPAATAFLAEGAAGKRRETVKLDDPLLKNVRHRIISSNRTVVTAVAARVEELGYEVLRAEDGVTGEARRVGLELAVDAMERQAGRSAPAAIILGGETTVVVRGEGRGGRNQELALAAAIELDDATEIVIAAFATDGVDGNSTAAGAVATPFSVSLAANAGVSAVECQKSNNSNLFFSACHGLITTGPTGTNVNDIAVALILPEGWWRDAPVTDRLPVRSLSAAANA